MKGFLDEYCIKDIRNKENGSFKTSVIFIDRDGVINRRMPPHKHVLSWSDFRILPGVYDAIAILNALRYPIIIISNQRCISLGTLTLEGLKEINTHMITDFDGHNVHVDGFYYCPHGDDEKCACRKPRSGLLQEAEYDLRKLGVSIDKDRSWMIGDEDTDVQAGRTYGVNTLLIDSSREGLKREILIADSLLSAVERITEGMKIE